MDIGAPGVGIYSTVPGGYGTSSGTSMAVPHVAGVVDLVLGQNPSWTTSQVISQVLSTSTKYTALAPKTVSGGIVNAFQAITSANPVIIDNGQSGYTETGSWTNWGTGYNSNLRYVAGAGSVTATATWQLSGLADGTYTVQATWNNSGSRATNAPFSIYDGSTLVATIAADQSQNPSGPSFGGVPFQTLATVAIHSGTLKVVLGNNANNYVIADAVRVAAT